MKMAKCFVKKAGVLLVLALMVSSVGATTANKGYQEQTAKTWYVKADAPPGGDGSQAHPFRYIQDGIDNASSLFSDTVFVYSGTYNEELSIGKSIHLIGENRETTILNGFDMFGIFVNIYLGSVEIADFTVTNFDHAIACPSGYAYIHDNIIKDNSEGIEISFSHKTIQGNTIINNEIGLNLMWCSANNDIGGSTDNLKNSIDNNEVGIYITDSNDKLSDEYLTNNNIFGTHNTVNIKRIHTNQPPSAPKISGPKSGKPGTSYEYTFLSTDPNGYEISYYVDWGDGTKTDWQGPYDSDTPLKLSHTWSEKGTFSIKCKAENDYGADSNWGTLNVMMPRDRAANSLLVNFLQSHPNLFPILRHLLNL